MTPQNLVPTFHPQNIAAAISPFRPDGQVPVLSPQHWDGGQCRIFKARFSRGEAWSIRVPIHVTSDSRETIVHVLQEEARILQELGQKGFVWAPKYYGSSFTFDNAVGFPFMVLSWMEGSPLVWTTTSPPRPIRDKVLRQIAEIQMTLIECTKEDGASTATQFFTRLIDNKLRRVRSGSLPDITVQDCFDQKNLLPQILHPELERAPFAIDHGDLSPSNIIVDSEYNVAGIIDWGFAAKVPIQLACRFPRFLQLPDLVLPPNSTLEQDRKTFTASLRPYYYDSLQAAAWMSLIHSSDDVDFRHCFLESMISKGMHLSLVRLKWKLPWSEELFQGL